MHRFLPPKAWEPTQGEILSLDLTKPVQCLQSSPSTLFEASDPTGPKSSEFIVQEDCLKLNIYTPLLADKKLPVLVWFGVGGFLFSQTPAPEGLRTGEMVHVEVNSRLGPFGYLCIQGTQVRSVSLNLQSSQ